LASANALFGRSATLIVSNEAPIKDVGSAPATKPTNGINLSELRFTFNITNGDTESPNTASIKVYNLKKDTRQKIINEYDTVTLQAGYQGNVGVIFRGTIKQFVAGNENNVNSFLEIRAADGDPNYNFGLFGVSGQGVTMAAGWTTQTQLGHVLTALGLPADTNASDAVKRSGGVNLAQVRGKTMFGLARAQASNMAASANARFSIQNGVVTFVPLTGYLPGKAVQINSLTGMVGTPEATDNGIQVTCLLNPLIKIGSSVQINNSDITQTAIKVRVGLNQFSEVAPFVADATEDGIYRVLVAEHSGDTRGREWYTKITALSIDGSASSQPSGTVKQFP
jgi:hypothetical protein